MISVGVIGELCRCMWKFDEKASSGDLGKWDIVERFMKPKRVVAI